MTTKNNTKFQGKCENFRYFSSGKGIAHTLGRRAAFFLATGEPNLGNASNENDFEKKIEK